MHVRGARRTGRAAGVHGRRAGRTGVCGQQARGAQVCAVAGACACMSMQLRVYCSPESTSFTRNHLNDLKC
ncbi:hypothetical protein CRG98_015340 [Punica granatum]|uniref:Uncharacterized protein n=1 Tax=Punica granatum TaxID=22663 RepID=A0A2I0K6U5_PUNGR|nr:hypothetical protein CRG98_015340 [Punica granatum]